MFPAILQSRNSLLKEITKLQAEINELKRRFNLVVNWINKCEIRELPEDVAKAMQLRFTEIIECLDEPVPIVVSEETADSPIVRKKKSSRTSSGDFTCKICCKQLKNINVLRAHEKEHLPPEVLVPIPRKHSDARVFKRRRHAYRCLTCGAILTDRRKYLAHVNKHRKNAQWKEMPEKSSKVQEDRAGKSTTCGNSPFVKLVDINFLNQNAVVNLEREYGICNVNSVIQRLSSQLHSNSNDKSIFEEEVPCYLELDEEESCDPLADVNSPVLEQSEATEEEKRMSAELSQILDSDVSLDNVKDEIKEEFDILEDGTYEEDLEDNVEFKGSFDAINSSSQSSDLEPSLIDSVITSRRKSRHKVLVENEDSTFSAAEVELSNSAQQPSSTAKAPNLRRRKSFRRIVYENENSGDSTTCDLKSKNNPKDDNNEVACDICNKILKNSTALSAHRNVHLPPEALIPVLRDDGRTRDDYIRPRYKYRCLVCHTVFTDKRKYVSHVKAHKRESKRSPTSKSYKKRESSNSNKESSKTVTSDEYSYSCDVCNIKCRTKSLLTAHKFVHLPPEVVLPYHSKSGYHTPSEFRNRYRCTFCEAILTDKRRYVKHMNGHKKGLKNVDDGEGPWNCKYCDKAFKTRSYFRFHEAAHVNAKTGKEDFCFKRTIKRVICEVCGQLFHNTGTLKTHMLSHTGSRPFLCDQCGKGFIRKQYLLNHELTHSDKRTFKCSFCDKAFKQLQSKYLHERRHKGHKVVCNLCGFTFSGSSALKSHIQGIHENIRRFQCTLCDKKFKTTSCRKTHMKTHANPNSRQRSINKDVDPLKAAAKRRHRGNQYTVPIIPSVANDLPVN